MKIQIKNLESVKSAKSKKVQTLQKKEKMIRSMSEDRSGNATGETVTVEVDPVTGARKLSTSSSRKTSNNSTINSAGSASGSSSSARKKKDSIGLLSRTIVKEQFR